MFNNKPLIKAQRIAEFSEVLRPFLPENTERYVAYFLVDKVVHFTITPKRKSKHGDYQVPHEGKPHRISVNGSLNKYAFLVTTIHELAHLTTYEKYGHRVAAHGMEWKDEFKKLFSPLLTQDIFPDDVQMALINYMNNIKASTCSDERLYRVLRRYDKNPKILVEHLNFGDRFRLNDRIFVMGRKLRKRYECIEWGTTNKYRILGLAEIDQLYE